MYVLPDNYEVADPSLDDIKYLLYPTFTPSLLKSIDANLSPSFTLDQKPYYPGFVGLNNIKLNSYMNVVLQALLHVIPLRNYFILDERFSIDKEGESGETELVKRFSMLCRKVWNPKAFKGQVSPHEFLQECSNRSGGKFRITSGHVVKGKKDTTPAATGGDPLEFLGWLLNTLHKDLGGNRKPRSSELEVRISFSLNPR